ncbi:thiamine phosphate synthase [Legionella spiritensis]|uniref:thiamine phosphate synthase n=1 Tax=Legionella spiritensis TaxID=452 RepID=UPI000F718339|nr:thiamine phosphate synthase [Legionella spiritensis]VEG90120.1 phosphomethylpyrimidine kinase ThiD/thiamin-phosphate pyrophosphorylase fused protein ThiE [Legionella spiritensis]
MNKPVVWSIAGVDPSGLVGMQADMDTLQQFNVAACSVITAVTAQNEHQVTAIECISPEHVASQCDALLPSFTPSAIKIGMLGEPGTPEKLAALLNSYSGYVVLDPVLASSSGTPLFFSDLKRHREQLVRLLPYVDVVTPNRIEAEVLLNRSLSSFRDLEEAAHALTGMGAKSVLLKGGHHKDPLFSQDYWTNGHDSFWLAGKRASELNYRGTGCVLSSAIAASLALGYCVKDAVVIGKMYVQRGIRHALRLNRHTARLFHNGWPEDQEDLPYLSPAPMTQLPKPFPSCRTGLYPVVDHSGWLNTLLPIGIKTIQLRIKNAPESLLEEEIRRSVALARQYGATLFVNDYYEHAIHLGATGVHLGQEDLLVADVDEIRRAGLYLGVSTHCYYEVAKAHAINPSYIACGPVYPTTSKIMAFKPQGREQLHRWRRTLRYPLVAIGGINLVKLPEVLATGVDGIAMISAITSARDPVAAAQQLLTRVSELRHE